MVTAQKYEDEAFERAAQLADSLPGSAWYRYPDTPGDRIRALKSRNLQTTEKAGISANQDDRSAPSGSSFDGDRPAGPSASHEGMNASTAYREIEMVRVLRDLRGRLYLLLIVEGKERVLWFKKPSHVASLISSAAEAFVEADCALYTIASPRPEGTTDLRPQPDVLSS